MEKPSIGKKIKVPRSETGTVSAGISVARTFCRNRNTTKITNSSASTSVVMISRTPSLTERVVSSETT